VAADFDSERLSCHAFERRGVSRGGPDLQLHIARRAQPHQVVVAAIVEFQAGDRLCVAAIEALRQAQDGGERANRGPRPPSQLAEALMLSLRRRLTMIAGDESNRLDLIGFESAEVAVLHEIVRMLVMALVTDVHADVVQNGGVLQPFPLAIGQPVDRTRLIEQRHRQPRDML
jgi:hypothetical protein